MNTIIPTGLDAGFSSQLEDFTKAPILITDTEGNPVSNFYYGSAYHFKITFSENALLQFAYFHDGLTEADYLTYTLPPQLKVQQTTVDQSPHPIFGESLTPEDPLPIIGQYFIALDGTIQVHFDNVDKYGNPAFIFDPLLEEYVPANFIDYYTDATFTLDISALFSTVGAEQEIDFGNELIVTITVENPLPGSLSIGKSSLVSALADKTVSYTISILGVDGPVSDISLEDTSQPGTNTWLEKAIFLDMTASIAGDTPFVPPEFLTLEGTVFDQGFQLSFPGVTLNPGEEIIVTFTLDISDIIDQWVLENPSPSGKYHFDIWLYNRATVEGFDEYADPIPPATANDNAWLLRNFLNKTGEQDLDYDYTAKWSNWSVGDGVTILNESVITDTLTGLIFAGNNTLPNDENGIYLTFFDPEANPIASWYFPVAQGATSFSFTVPKEDDMVISGTDENGVYVQGWGEHFSSLLPFGPITKVIVANPFWTNVADEGDFEGKDSNSYQNTITVEIDSDTPSFTVDIDIYRPGATPIISKSGSFGGTGDEIEYLQWEISYYVPKASYNQPVYFMDDFLMYGYDNSSPTEARRLAVVNVPENFKLTVYSEDLGLRELVPHVDYTLLDSANHGGFSPLETLPTQWFLFFIGDTSELSWSQLFEETLWPFNDDTWLTITYQIPLDAIVGEGENTLSLKEALQWSKGPLFSQVQNWIYSYNPIKNITPSASLFWAILKSAVVTGDTITYRIELRREHFTFADILTDVFDPLLAYVPFSMRLWKREDSSVYYGPYEMIDESFTDMSLAGILDNTMSFDFLNMYRINWDLDKAVYYPDPTKLSDATPANESYILEFQMSLKEDAPLGQHSVTNQVEINGFTNEWTADIGTKIVEKTMAAASNIANVSILINPDEKTLDGIQGKYTITDISSDSLAMYLTTLVVEAFEGGLWVPHPLVNNPSGDIWTYTTTGANEISFVVPDNTTLRVTYQALIKGEVGDTVTISNQVRVAGEYYDFWEEDFFISDTSGSCTGTHSTLRVLKSDTHTSAPLPGAIFALYIGLAYPGWEQVWVPGGIEGIITIGSTDFYYLASGSTNELGLFLFDNPWLTPSHMAIYALVEIQSPPGYTLPLEPTSLFSYTPPTPQQKEALGPRQEDVQQISDMLSIENTKQEDVSAIIQGTKLVTGNKPPDTLFTFTLTQVADSEGSPLAEAYTDTAISLGAGSFGFSLSGLLAGETYYYKITEETNPSDKSWIFDPNATTGYVVSVTVLEDYEVIITYPDEGDFLSFSNHYLGIITPASILLSAHKQALGAVLPCGKFSFGLFDKDDNLLYTAKNILLFP